MNRPVRRGGDTRGIVMILLVAAVAMLGCDDLDGRGQNRVGNRRFRESRFIDAAAAYERALAKVKDDKIEYNIGLAYQKMFKPGVEGVILLAEAGSPVCEAIPGTESAKRRVCVKNNPDEEDRTYVSCGDSKDAICPSSASCKELDLCAIQNDKLVDLSAGHLNTWIDKQPPDEELKKKSKELSEVVSKMEADIRDAETEIDKYVDPTTGVVKDKPAWNEATQKRASLEEKVKVVREERDEVELKFRIRELMTQMFLDAKKFDKAIAYWDRMLKEKPGDLEAMGNLAGINLKADKWRTAIEWYTKVADQADDDQTKLTALGFIGNVAWSKLNSKTLPPVDALELADLGIGALQKASAKAPKNLRFLGTQASIYNFRALQHGASWAAAIDRASSQDLKAQIDVVSGKAKPPTEKPDLPAPTPPGPEKDSKDKKPDPKAPNKTTPGPAGSGKKASG
jgi:tetratricopeptide (TPR) repeat protein